MQRLLSEHCVHAVHLCSSSKQQQLGVSHARITNTGMYTPCIAVTARPESKACVNSLLFVHTRADSMQHSVRAAILAPANTVCWPTFRVSLPLL
jgi:hypothetical protein